MPTKSTCQTVRKHGVQKYRHHTKIKFSELIHKRIFPRKTEHHFLNFLFITYLYTTTV